MGGGLQVERFITTPAIWPPTASISSLRATGSPAAVVSAATTRMVASIKGARVMAMSLRSAAGVSMTTVSAWRRSAAQ
ncbi:hypothetical protein D3C80_1512180 [compost metagenome]